MISSRTHRNIFSPFPTMKCEIPVLFEKPHFRPENYKNKLYRTEPAAPEPQNTSFFCTNIGLLVTQKAKGGLTGPLKVQVAEDFPETAKVKLRPKKNKRYSYIF